jgi:hypothetical protein
MIEAAVSFETLVLIHQTKWCHIPEDHNLKILCYENLKHREDNEYRTGTLYKKLSFKGQYSVLSDSSSAKLTARKLLRVISLRMIHIFVRKTDK